MPCAGATALGKLHMVNLAASELAEKEGDRSLRALGSCLQVRTPTQAESSMHMQIQQLYLATICKDHCTFSTVSHRPHSQHAHKTHYRRTLDPQGIAVSWEMADLVMIMIIDMMVGCVLYIRRCG